VVSEYTSKLASFAQSARPFHCKDIKKAKLENRILRVSTITRILRDCKMSFS
jgi:hypothetical protein